MIDLKPSFTAMMKKVCIFFGGWITTKLPWFHQSTLERRHWKDCGRNQGKFNTTNIICLFCLVINLLKSLKFLMSLTSQCNWMVMFFTLPWYHMNQLLYCYIVGVQLFLQWTKTIPHQIHWSSHWPFQCNPLPCLQNPICKVG